MKYLISLTYLLTLYSSGLHASQKYWKMLTCKNFVDGLAHTQRLALYKQTNVNGYQYSNTFQEIKRGGMRSGVIDVDLNIDEKNVAETITEFSDQKLLVVTGQVENPSYGHYRWLNAKRFKLTATTVDSSNSVVTLKFYRDLNGILLVKKVVFPECTLSNNLPHEH